MLLHMDYFKTQNNKLIAYRVHEDIVTGQQSIMFSRILFFFYKSRKKFEQFDLASIHTEVTLVKERELNFIREHIEKYYDVSKEIEDPIEIFIPKLDLQGNDLWEIFSGNSSLQEFFGDFKGAFEWFKILKENAEAPVRRRKTVKSKD